MKIYVASSWRNVYQPNLIKQLRSAGHEVYDFHNPKEGNHGFHWGTIDPAWREWDETDFRRALHHPIAEEGFKLDWEAMQWANVCVLLLPCGRSAHLEAGYFVGAKKKLIILLLEKGEPELMYKMAGDICITVYEVLESLSRAQIEAEKGGGE